jgi:hypothetical protein
MNTPASLGSQRKEESHEFHPCYGGEGIIEVDSFPLHETACHQASVETENKVINVLTWLEGQVLPLLAKCLQCGLASAVAANAYQASLTIRFMESKNCILGKTAAMKASSARRSS